ncbi:MAG: hypothetical protein ACFE8E_14160 [Candidatus Hodarchaeota archaeon]
MTVKKKTTHYSERNRYDVYSANNIKEAIKFLRKQEIKLPYYYIVIETPEGNIGKDIIGIYNEQNSELIELGRRKKLPNMKKSQEFCTQCGYFVFPMKPFNNEVSHVLNIEDMCNKGVGFYCSSCETVWCAQCVVISGYVVKCKLCRTEMVPFQK